MARMRQKRRKVLTEQSHGAPRLAESDVPREVWGFLPKARAGRRGSTPSGKLQMHILGAIAEFERARIIERVRAGPARRAAQGKPLGCPRQTISEDDLARTIGPRRGRRALSSASRTQPSTARGLSQKPSDRPPGLRLKRALFRAWSAVTVATVAVTEDRFNNPSRRSFDFRPGSTARPESRSRSPSIRCFRDGRN